MKNIRLFFIFLFISFFSNILFLHPLYAMKTDLSSGDSLEGSGSSDFANGFEMVSSRFIDDDDACTSIGNLKLVIHGGNLERVKRLVLEKHVPVDPKMEVYDRIDKFRSGNLPPTPLLLSIALSHFCDAKGNFSKDCGDNCKKYLDISKFLIKHGANINSIANTKNVVSFPITVAIMLGCEPHIYLLFEGHLNVLVRDEKYIPVLFYVPQDMNSDKKERILQKLLKAGAPFTVDDFKRALKDKRFDLIKAVSKYNSVLFKDLFFKLSEEDKREIYQELLNNPNRKVLRIPEIKNMLLQYDKKSHSKEEVPVSNSILSTEEEENLVTEEKKIIGPKNQSQQVMECDDHFEDEDSGAGVWERKTSEYKILEKNEMNKKIKNKRIFFINNPHYR